MSPLAASFVFIAHVATMSPPDQISVLDCRPAAELENFSVD